MADTHSIRASVYDVFLELGALDADSNVAAWFFGDPNSSIPDVSSTATPRGPIRFTENFTEDPETTDLLSARGDNARQSRSTTRGFGLKFSPRRMSRSKIKPTPSPPDNIRGTIGTDGYETDEGYASASPNGSPKPKSPKSRLRAAAFTLRSPSKSRSGDKPLPALPTIKEKPTPQRSATAPAAVTAIERPPTPVQRAKSLFRRRTKSPPPPMPVPAVAIEQPRKSGADSLLQWQAVANIMPRVFNPSAANGEALSSPSSISPFAVAPSSFRQLTAPATEDAVQAQDERSFTLPRAVFRRLSVTKRRLSSRRKRPRSLDLSSTSEGSRVANSMPASPFVLVTEDTEKTMAVGVNTPGGLPGTPFVLVAPIDNPTPLHSATMRRFSDVTSMTAPLGFGLAPGRGQGNDATAAATHAVTPVGSRRSGVYPLSISRTLRRSMHLGLAATRSRTSLDLDLELAALQYEFDDQDVPASPPARLRPSSSYSSFQDALAQAASAASPYEYYDTEQDGPIRIRRGIEAPFPVYPVLRTPLSTSYAHESRLATIQRYREFSEQLVEVMPYKQFAEAMV
ncbi:hypothetical protein MKEN_01092900 [Mycena kentingensis (nom. inval.)]|nr:hypothetical protein MKEN_01092900 [Mycena kentingensis (nom. inval.)]